MAERGPFGIVRPQELYLHSFSARSGWMSPDPNALSAMFRIDVTADATPAPKTRSTGKDVGFELAVIMREMLAVQQKQAALLEDLIQQVNAGQRQRAQELNAWKQANPGLAKQCRTAAEALSKVQTEYLKNISDEVIFSEDNLLDGDFALNEFVDRYGPRLAHLNGVLQVLSQLAANQPAESRS
jgi:hypothetical protein